MRRIAALLVLLAPAALAEPLVLARVDGEPRAKPALRLIFSYEDGRWRSVETRIADAMQAQRLGGIIYGKKNDAPRVTLDRGTFGRAVFGAEVGLSTWYGPGNRDGRSEMNAGDAAQLGWGCRRGWGIGLKEFWQEGSESASRLMTNRRVAIDYFVEGPADEVRDADPANGDWRIASAAEEAAAILRYRESSRASDHDHTATLDTARIASLPLAFSSRRSDWGADREMVWIEAIRPLHQDESPLDRCRGPRLVYTGLFQVSADGAVTRTYGAVDVQDCNQALPRQPEALLRVDGAVWMLRYDRDPDGARESIYAIDQQTGQPAAEPAASHRVPVCNTASND